MLGRSVLFSLLWSIVMAHPYGLWGETTVAVAPTAYCVELDDFTGNRHTQWQYGVSLYGSHCFRDGCFLAGHLDGGWSDGALYRADLATGCFFRTLGDLTFAPLMGYRYTYLESYLHYPAIAQTIEHRFYGNSAYGGAELAYCAPAGWRATVGLYYGWSLVTVRVGEFPRWRFNTSGFDYRVMMKAPSYYGWSGYLAAERSMSLHDSNEGLIVTAVMIGAIYRF